MIMKRIMGQAIAALLASSAAAMGAPPVISSEPFARAEYVQFGGPSYGTACTATPCTIYSGGPAVLSVDRTNTGEYVIAFATGTWAEPPTCTAIGGGAAQNAFARIGANPTTASFTLQFSTPSGSTIANPSGTADQFVTVTCMGPYR